MSTIVSTAESQVYDMLCELQACTVCEPIDAQLAKTVARRGNALGESGIAVALAMVFASRAVREGHSAISISKLASEAVHARIAAPNAIAAALPLSDESWWTRTLAESDVVSDGVRIAPLVLRDGLVQLRRYYDAECRIAMRIHALLGEATVGGVPGFSIVTGGPGTGKTTFVAQRLLELRAAHPTMRVALAAPTGKAAARLTESIRLKLDDLARNAEERAKAPTDAKTLHRLLAYSPDTDRYRRNASDPLDDDLVIVDEASMVDVLMLDALLRALKPGARLMLVGDHQQLPSVDAGDVLGTLCRVAERQPAGSLLRQSVTVLTESFRFSQQPAIGVLATAILAGDTNAVVLACSDPQSPQVQLRAPAVDTASLVDPIVSSVERCLAADSPSELLHALESFRVLAPEREGELGVAGINDAVERWLSRRGHSVYDTWYHRRPVMVTANDYATGVFNGDVGVVWRERGTVAVYFRGNDGSVRAIAPARLPSVETAWAMTVHKSQGSEFDDVLMVIPELPSRMMNRALLYTAVTRAKRGVTVIGSGAAVKTAVERVTGRMSGLGERMVSG